MVGMYDFKEHPQLAFTFNDFGGMYPHDDDPLFISALTVGFQIKRTMVDTGRSANVLFWEVFKRLDLPKEVMKEHRGSLLGFATEIIGYVDLRTTFGEGENAKTIVIKYIVVDARSSYNIILGRPTLNGLRAVTSTAHLCMKYPLEDGRVGVVKGDQITTRKCYEDSLRNKRAKRRNTSEDQHCNFLDLDPRGFSKDKEEWHPRPAKELKEVQIGEELSQMVKIGTTLSREMEENLKHTLKKNLDVFAWSAKDMPGIDPNFIFHRLAIDPMARAVQQRKRKMSMEKQKAVQEETHQLVKAKFIREVKYLTWLANVVMVKKPSGKWRMCTATLI